MAALFSQLLEGIGASPRAATAANTTRAASPDSVLSVITVDDTNAPQYSSSSTPPTSIGDHASISSTSLKLENAEATPLANAPSSASRSQRKRASVPTYNIKVLTGTAVHAPHKFDINAKTGLPAAHAKDRRRTISGDTFVGLDLNNSSTETIQKNASRLVRDGIDALDLQWSPKSLPKSRSQIGLGGSSKKSNQQKEASRRATRASGEKIESLTKKLSVLGKRSRKTFEEGLGGLTRAARELKRLADTNEFAGIDTKPVIHEVWSNGKLVVPESPRKKRKAEEAAKKKAEEDAEPVEKKKAEAKPDIRKKGKVWLNKGLYAGQTQNFDWFKDSSLQAQKDMETVAPYKPNGFMPLPMWHGQRLLHTGRDFKLPFDVCSPLPPGQPKPDEWRKTSSNRFVGDAAALWRKEKHLEGSSSKCVCTADYGCGEGCQNRVMYYECDETNCNVGKDHCRNRAFADLQERRKAGGKFRVGVEVIKTANRGHGVRANRQFEANQIIVEYTGEIITEDECDRRMNEVYKDNECYYLMMFHQNMILDGTKGSIARFVNHSCEPNCEMVKWIVGGKPRMALFAGSKPIMTGDELTYDYNFDPFSAKNVQVCRCGSETCRGILGPKPKPVKESIKEVLKAGVKAGKRKLKELLGGDIDEEATSPKKRKIKNATGAKRSNPSASMIVAKKTASTVRRGLSTSLSSTRKSVGTKRGSNVIVKKSSRSSSSVRSRNGKTMKTSSRTSSLTMVATEESPRSKRIRKETFKVKSMRKSAVRSIRGGSKKARGASEGTIRVVLADEDPDATEDEE